MKTVAVLLLMTLGRCHCHLSLLGSLLSSAHESIHKVAGGLAHGLNIKVDTHVQTQDYQPPAPNQDLIVVVQQEGYGRPEQGSGAGYHKPHHFHGHHHGYHAHHGYGDPPPPNYDPDCDRYGNPNQGNRPNYGSNGNGQYGSNYPPNNPVYESNYGSNMPNQGQQYGNSAGGYGNQGQLYGNNAGGYGNQGQLYGDNAGGYGNQGQQYGNSAGGYGNQGITATPSYGLKPQYQDKPYGNAQDNTNAVSNNGPKPNLGYDNNNQGTYGTQGNNNGGSSYSKPQYEEDKPTQPGFNNAGHSYGDKPQYEDNPNNPQPTPSHETVNYEPDQKPSTKNPDGDFPLFVPLSPELVYSGDKQQVLEPKREASTEMSTAAEDEEFPIDIRFKDE